MAETAVLTLADFLLARIAEDEAVARAAIANGEGALDWADAGDPTDVHIARWDPSRVLTECEAKRRIVDGEQYPAPGGVPLWALGVLALPYADHPDYREEWRG